MDGSKKDEPSPPISEPWGLDRFPAPLALGYSVLATSTSMIVAQIEGRLWHHQDIVISGGRVVRVAPFIENVSTLADFILLNPIIILFLLSATQKRREVYVKMQAGEQIPLYHRIGLTVLAVAFGFTAMKVYVGGFNQFFDATIIPSGIDSTQITGAGWVVFSWTAIFISFLFYSCAEQAFYAKYVISLRKKDLPYRPLHYDRAGGARFLMEPSLKFAYAMIALLIVFAAFIVYDKILHHISDSNRLWGFVFYVAIIVPLFVFPFLRLHTLMKERRDEYLIEVSGALDEILLTAKMIKTNISVSKIQKNISSMEYYERYRKTVTEFPVWPLPLAISAPPIGSIVAALLPLGQKLITIVLAQFIASSP